MERLLTGLQPSGALTIGNFCGGINQVIKYQEQYETFLFVPDLHAITVPQDPKQLTENIKQAVGLYLACGVDPSLENMHIYVQSENPYHANLSWILECFASFGELSRMHQFKTKTQNKESFSCGLFTYPVLMASDILLYDAKYVPTGIDQKQHVELARDLAVRFNNKFGQEHFVVPNPLIPEIGAKIRDLQAPQNKMSKSTQNKKASIFLTDDARTIESKIKGAVTDTLNQIVFDEVNQPGISNLLTIYSVFTGKEMSEVLAYFSNERYGFLKKAVSEVLVEKIQAIQANYQKIMTTGVVDEALDAGKAFSLQIAEEKYDQIRKVVGLGR